MASFNGPSLMAKPEEDQAQKLSQRTPATHTGSGPTLTTMSRGGEDDDGADLSPDPELDTTFPGCLSVAPEVTCVNLTICFPFFMIAGCGVFVVAERSHHAVLYFGKYMGSVMTPGIHCLPPFGRELRGISTATRTMNMKDLKVLDRRGNPVVISAVVTFEPTSSKRARIDVQNPWPNASWQSVWYITPPGGTYLELQAQAVLKQVTSQFPYEAPEGQPSLQTEGAHLTQMLCRTLQQRVNGTGARILSFDLVDLSYAPEIAQAMLVRQQAAALVDARKLIVKAAVDMTTSAVKSLEAQMEGRKLPNDVKDRICTNLLTVVCSSEAVTPTLGVGS